MNSIRFLFFFATLVVVVAGAATFNGGEFFRFPSFKNEDTLGNNNIAYELVHMSRFNSVIPDDGEIYEEPASPSGEFPVNLDTSSQIHHHLLHPEIHHHLHQLAIRYLLRNKHIL